MKELSKEEEEEGKGRTGLEFSWAWAMMGLCFVVDFSDLVAQRGLFMGD